MSIKILKSLSGDYDLKDEDDVRIRDSKLDSLTYHDGHVELVNDQIDEVKLQGIVRDRNDLKVLSMSELLHRGLDISESKIDNITMEDDCWLHLYNKADVEKLTCRNAYAEASMRGEACVNQLIVENGGAMSAKHGQIIHAHVGRGGGLIVSERSVISRCEVCPTGTLRVGYRIGSVQSVPVIHSLKMYADSTLNIKGDVAIGTLEVFCAAKVRRQFIATVFIGKLIVDNHPVTDVASWLHKHSVDAIP